jgi:hypothetical protein
MSLKKLEDYVVVTDEMEVVVVLAHSKRHALEVCTNEHIFSLDLYKHLHVCALSEMTKFVSKQDFVEEK